MITLKSRKISNTLTHVFFYQSVKTDSKMPPISQNRQKNYFYTLNDTITQPLYSDALVTLICTYGVKTKRVSLY